MEENKNFVEVKSSESKNFNTKKTNKGQFSFGRNVFLPFVSGVIGAGVLSFYPKSNIWFKLWK